MTCMLKNKVELDNNYNVFNHRLESEWTMLFNVRICYVSNRVQSGNEKEIPLAILAGALKQEERGQTAFSLSQEVRKIPQQLL